MGVLKFRFDPSDLASRLPELRSAYFTGLDRTPSRTTVNLQPGTMTCSREGPESCRLHVPWPVEGHGTLVTGTATLAERVEPFNLPVELARGRLNDIRNQSADWRQLGLICPGEFEQTLSDAQRAFTCAATSRHDPLASSACAQTSLSHAFLASRYLVEAYTDQVLRRRLEYGSRIPTLLSCGLEGDPRKVEAMATVAAGFNSGRICCNWARLAPTEGKYRWKDCDDQLAWCRAAKLTPTAGPLIDLRPGMLPDWLWLWSGDYEQILNMVEELVREAVSRYRGKIPVWHLLNRVGSSDILGLTEEEQFRITARALHVARRADPDAQFVIDFDRPWGDWLASSPFQIGPLHLADSLARLELGMAGIGLEFALGFSSPGSLLRDLFEFSRLLDLYAMINLPIYVSIAVPSASGPDPKADPNVSVTSRLWPQPPNEALQLEWAARWLALAVAKPFVRGVHWLQASDAHPHLYPHAGLLRADGTSKPLLDWIRGFRSRFLE